MLHNAIRWLAGFVEDGMTGKPSSKRWALLLAVMSMCIATLILAAAAYMGRAVGVEITATTTTLATLVGYCYVQGKKVERAFPTVTGEPAP